MFPPAKRGDPTASIPRGTTWVCVGCTKEVDERLWRCDFCGDERPKEDAIHQSDTPNTPPILEGPSSDGLYAQPPETPATSSQLAQTEADSDDDSLYAPLSPPRNIAKKPVAAKPAVGSKPKRSPREVAELRERVLKEEMDAKKAKLAKSERRQQREDERPDSLNEGPSVQPSHPGTAARNVSAVGPAVDPEEGLNAADNEEDHAVYDFSDDDSNDVESNDVDDAENNFPVFNITRATRDQCRQIIKNTWANSIAVAKRGDLVHHAFRDFLGKCNLDEVTRLTMESLTDGVIRYIGGQGPWTPETLRSLTSAVLDGRGRGVYLLLCEEVAYCGSSCGLRKRMYDHKRDIQAAIDGRAIPKQRFHRICAKKKKLPRLARLAIIDRQTDKLFTEALESVLIIVFKLFTTEPQTENYEKQKRVAFSSRDPGSKQPSWVGANAQLPICRAPVAAGVICQVCYTQVSKYQLQDHFNNRHPDVDPNRPYLCPTCGKGFGKKSTLTDHMVTHTDEKPHECQVCKKRFKLKQSLTGHAVVHSDERPYTCQHCGMTHRRAKDLTAHTIACPKNPTNTRSSKGTHKCQDCDHVCSRKEDLTRHAILAHGRDDRVLKCPYCGYTNTSVKNTVGIVSNHIAKCPMNPTNARGGEPPLRCQHCGFASWRQEEQTRHAKTCPKKPSG